MASRKHFKRELNNMVIDVIEECFSIQLYNESKTEATERLIDEVVEFRNSIVQKMYAAKSKKDYPAIHAEVEDAAVDFIHKINEIH